MNHLISYFEMLNFCFFRKKKKEKKVLKKNYKN